MCMVRVFNQLGDKVGDVTNDRDDVFYSQWGYFGGTYPFGSWGCTTSHYRGFYALLIQVQGVWTSLGVFATADEARQVWQELYDFVEKHKNAPMPKQLPEYHTPRGKNSIDAYAVFKSLDNR